MNRITLLPKWAIPSHIPSVYDTESKTCLDMTSKVYGAMRQLQEDYNVFVDEINKTIIDFVNGTNQDHEKFKEDITKLIHDYIRMLDDKVKNQDLVINESIAYIKNNLNEGIVNILNEMKENGELEAIIVEALEGVTTKLNSLEVNISSINNSINTLSSNVSKNENDITELNDKVTNLEKKNGFIYDETEESLTFYIGGEI